MSFKYAIVCLMATPRRKKHIITIGGLPGSGKSTVGRILAKRLGYKTFSTGDFVRTMAIQQHTSLTEFNEKIAHDKQLEEAIDNELIRIENEGDEYVIDSHLGFHFVPSSFSVFLEASLKECARRIFNDSTTEIRIQSKEVMGTLEEAEEKTRGRVENHRRRYMEHYHIDPYVASHYDLTINADENLPEHIVDIIELAYKSWLET